MHFRKTASRLAVVRLGFCSEASRLLPHFSGAKRHTTIDEINEPENHRFVSPVETEADQRFGAHPGSQHCGYAGHRDTDLRSLARALETRRNRADTLAKALTNLAKRKPLSGDLPPAYSFDGEISRRFADVLSGWRATWAQRGVEMGTSAGRTFELSKDGVVFKSPHGFTRLYRAAFYGDGEDDGYVGTVTLEDRIARRGGVYRIEQSVCGRNLVLAGKEANNFVIARTLIRENGRLFAREIIRRLRDGVRPSFRAAHSGTAAATKVTLTAGKMDKDTVSTWMAQANRLNALVERHKAVVERLEEYGRELARAWATSPEVAGAELRARLAYASEDFAIAMSRYNNLAPQFCLKKSLATYELPLTQPPATFPAVKAGLCQRDTNQIESAMSHFAHAWEEFNTAKSVMEEWDLANPAPDPITAEEPAGVPDDLDVDWQPAAFIGEQQELAFA